MAPKWNNGYVSTSRRQADAPTLITIVGTGYLGPLAYPEMLPPGEIIAIDAADEIALLRLREVAGRHVHLVPIAEHETLQGLIGHFGTTEQRRLLAELPNTSARNGLGQLRAIGGSAMSKLFRDGELERYVRETALPNLQRMAGGHLDVVQHIHLSGLSGGMGSLGGRLFAEQVQIWVTDELDCQIESEVRLIGSATFAGADFTRTKENASIGITEWCHRLKNPVSPKATTQLVLTELYPVGKDKELRDWQVFELQQALAADEIVENQNRDKPNKSVTGSLGGTRNVRFDQFKRLEHEEIASEAARSFGESFGDVLNAQADSGIVERFGLYTANIPLRRPSIESLMEDALLCDADEILEGATLAKYRYRAEPYVQLRGGRSPVRLGNVKRTFTAPLTNTRDAANRLQLIRTCKAVCQREIDERNLFRDELLDQLDELSFLARKRLADLRGRLFVLRSEEARIDRAEQALVDVRNCADELHELEAGISASENAIAQLLFEETSLVRPLSGMLQHFRQITAKCDDGSQPYVEPVPVDSVYEELMNLAERTDVNDRDVVHLLSRTTRVCTLHGLGRIVGADASIDAIVRAILDEENLVYRCPAWGANVNSQTPERRIVFPPVDEKTQGQLRDQFRRLGGPPVSFAKTALGSVNVTIVEVIHAREADEVLTPYYRSGVKRALNSNLSDLFVGSREAIQSLGLDLQSRGDSDADYNHI